ncbi:hypothetical protein [Dysgonomonas gadei]|uniref:Uncharacterized protein n=1 Tax=Dysgonomonas gadei ATCC BAA-286 TaxID=742766 RepID=F5J1A5_9BACT|nr:hypothetical protein [Dysgonomonas gadei]EGK00479.1 hypothetical protein HMPREF9455_03122 [Dysgonomonas gadei ATCC BAA-286]
MKKKLIKALVSFKINNKWYKQDEEFIITLLNTGFSGGYERSSTDGAVLGDVIPQAIVEFEDGAIAVFEIGTEISILKNAGIC